MAVTAAGMKGGTRDVEVALNKVATANITTSVAGTHHGRSQRAGGGDRYHARLRFPRPLSPSKLPICPVRS